MVHRRMDPVNEIKKYLAPDENMFKQDNKNVENELKIELAPICFWGELVPDCE